MILTAVEIQRFRNLDFLDFSPAPGINVLHGKNGAGKTSILEALYCLSTGHSFRTRKHQELIQHGRDCFLVAGNYRSSDEVEHRVGLQRGTNKVLAVRLDHEDVRSLSVVSRELPFKALTPDSHELVQGAPTSRRQFIDWGAFHDEEGFIEHWRRYRRSLQQRNQALREQLPDAEVISWNEQLAASGEAIHRCRDAHLRALLPECKTLFDAFEVTGELSWNYRPGWAKDCSLLDALANSLDSCRRFRTTTVGPHRADLIMHVGGHPARQTLSRGQQKLMVYALHLSQLMQGQLSVKEPAVLLLDDIRSELDSTRFAKLMDIVRKLNIQAFMTMNELDYGLVEGYKSFHVKHGRISP